jgi:ATP-dependent Lon protease
MDLEAQDGLHGIDFDRPIPIFPLPNAVLLPRVLLPLHIFEPRYRIMTEDALASTRLIAVALLKPCSESLYYTPQADIHSIVCVGKICKEERLGDGRYNFLLQGLVRARVVDEKRNLAYRQAMLEPILPRCSSREAELSQRKAIHQLIRGPSLSHYAARGNWLNLFECSTITFSDMLDLLASSVLDCVDARQQFLSEPCVVERSRLLRHMLIVLGNNVPPPSASPRLLVRDWPPRVYEN